ncbi:MAG: response regulator [Desulfopila sp.]|jgi:DNA-binding NtrC family response regulator|nr:response regulator [Desulfopila sp.]
MNTLSILVVDDDPVIRKLLEQRLKKAGYSVDVAEDGYKAEKLLQKRRYDVILTDLMMPGGIGGIEVLEIAKEIDQNVEVILITAHSSVDTAVAAMKKGAIDYLEKPINFDELFLRIEKIVNVKSIMRNALDIHEAMGTTEQAASRTIQDLEVIAAKLQQRLDLVENELRDSTKDPESRIAASLDILAGF